LLWDHRIPEKEVDWFLYRDAERGKIAERRTNFRRISGRNQLIGGVTDIKISGLFAQVSLSIGGQTSLPSSRPTPCEKCACERAKPPPHQ
jgi:hypothetical protein